MKSASVVLTVLFVVCLAGFSQQALAVELQGTSIASLPAAVQEAVKRECPGAYISDFDDGDFDEIPVYEINGTSADGIEFQLEVGKDGTVYQKDEDVSLQDLSPAVLATIKKQNRLNKKHQSINP